MRWPRIVAAIIVLLLAGFLVACNGGGGSSTLTATVTPETAELTQSQAPTATLGPRLSTVEIVRKLRPSVVHVLTEDTGGFGTTSRGVGTGIIIDTDGHIVTNNHVVRVGGVPTGRIAGRVTVTLFDGETAIAEVVGTDPETDVAVLQIDVAGLIPAELGDTATLPVGSDVVAMGFALALQGDPTVTRGVVSAKNRTLQQQSINISIPDAIQTDASINPGNSGGPLVDDRGRVVGINSAIIPGAQNIGFAISIDIVRPIAAELIESGRVARGFLGVSFDDVTPSLAAIAGLPVDQGVIVNDVVAGSPAELAGLRPDDIIVGLEEASITSSGDLLEALRRYRVGAEVTVRFYRDGGEQEATTVLVDRPN